MIHVSAVPSDVPQYPVENTVSKVVHPSSESSIVAKNAQTAHTQRQRVVPVTIQCRSRQGLGGSISSGGLKVAGLMGLLCVVSNPHSGQNAAPGGQSAWHSRHDVGNKGSVVSGGWPPRAACAARPGWAGLADAAASDGCWASRRRCWARRRSARSRLPSITTASASVPPSSPAAGFEGPPAGFVARTDSDGRCFFLRYAA